jgi:predicted RecB family endonuclease
MNPLYIARTTEIAARALGDEMMIMSARDSTLFSLNDVASILWQAADGRTPLQEIVEQRVCTEFDVEPTEALKDAEEFARELAAVGILLISDQPIL